MTFTNLLYTLSNGFVQNWLVAGPLATPIPDLSSYPSQDLELCILRKFASPDLDVSLPPVDLGPLKPVAEGSTPVTWRYYHCLDDHLIDLTTSFPACFHLRSWAYAGINAPDRQEVTLILSSYGPASLWLNGKLLRQCEYFDRQVLERISIPAVLETGQNDLLIRFDSVALHATPYAVALQVQGSAQAEIVIPTGIEPEMRERRQTLEKVIEKAYLDRYVYGYLTGDTYDRNEPITLRFSSNLEDSGEITLRLQSLRADIFLSGVKRAEAGSEYELARMFPLRSGPHHLALMPEDVEYYMKKIQFDRKDLFFVVRTPYAFESYGMINERAQEALDDASRRRNESLFCEIAKIALGRWEMVDRKILNTSIERIKTQQEDSIFDLLGILGMMLRFWKQRFFLDDVRPVIESAIKHYHYWSEDPGRECMDFASESRQILLYACELLAGQLLPEGKFVESGKSGRWHREQGEQRLLAWLVSRGQFGVREWDSPASLEATLAALSHLTDLAKSQSVRDLAATLMDKIFFSLAVNSWKGMFGASHGCSDMAGALSHRLEATSGISRLMWGLGNFNDNVMGVVSLAACRKYELPNVIRKIALDMPAAFWSRERSGQPSSGNSSSKSLSWEADRVVYKTENFMLASAQDYDPGRHGKSEQVWQATLGPDALVFTSHPVCLSEENARQPNMWVGNGALPRLAQWGDVLVALYRLPQEDWLGFTHAYFPALAFNEYRIEENWAFARIDQGYLALYAARGLEWITGSKTAFRELRSRGLENAWLCHMGQELLDGSFTDFQQKILAMDLHIDGLSVRFTSLRGDAISFAWEGPLLVNGQEQALSGFKQFENPYCIADLPAQQIDILYGEEGIRLSFEA